jgi:hypothetical protein
MSVKRRSSAQDKRPTRCQQADFWRNRLGDRRGRAQSWILFRNGTAVLPESGRSLDDLANAAISTLIEVGEWSNYGAAASYVNNKDEYGWLVEPFYEEGDSTGVYVYVSTKRASSAVNAIAIARRAIAADKSALQVVASSAK